MNKRILLVEDNPVSREFLHEALKPLAIMVDVADTLAAACLLARQRAHTLFLCDVHLPDAGPLEIFESLIRIQPKTEIVAITAEANPTVSLNLRDMGYRDVWGKPISMATLQNNVARLIDVRSGGALPETEFGHWDESSALRAVGNNPATLEALRKLFLAELPLQIKTIETAQKNNDVATVKSECHKLLSGCGFVGAIRLAHAVRQLSENSGDNEMLILMTGQANLCLAAN